MKKECEQRGLYVPQLEKDACGIGLIANLNNEQSHLLIEQAITMLEKMEHRGACGCEPNTGDGAGILIQVPDAFFREEGKKQGFELPPFGHYGVGMLFLPPEQSLYDQVKSFFEKQLKELGFELLGYRRLETDNESVGETSVKVEPIMEQVFVRHQEEKIHHQALERKLFLLRNVSSHRIHQAFPETKDAFYFTSFSYKTVVYKGQLTTWQLRPYFADLKDERVVSAIALVHSRFSTNTFPKWRLAQPFRYVAHNGEINTIRGNLNWWRTKEILLESDYFSKEELDMLFPICDPSQSDSANFDNVVELLHLCGRSLPHVLMMMIPEAWQGNELMEDDKRAFYEYHKSLMEPWDGPASLCFTDGIIVGATLDRNGLRPSRYILTKNNHIILASEAGVLPIEPSEIVFKGRLQPGKMLVADLDEGRIISDEEVKKTICSREPYQAWLDAHKLRLSDLPKTTLVSTSPLSLLTQQLAFGYTKEDIQVLLKPMAVDGKGAIGSMGADTPLAVLSTKSQHLSNYFKQLFAQVTNPPIDPIRERAVMSLYTSLGSQLNVLTTSPEHCQQLHLEQPILTNEALAQIRSIEHPAFKAATIPLTFSTSSKIALKKAVQAICQRAEEAVKAGVNILILSDKCVDEKQAPIPSLLATGAIHHHLIQKGLRAQASLVVEAGDVRESHHFATLIGYGAGAINPYLAFETLLELQEQGEITTPKKEVVKNYIKAVGKELLKIFSKIGISTLQSYKGAQIFEALGLNQEVIDQCFKGTISRIEGIGFEGIAEEVLTRHKVAFKQEEKQVEPQLDVGGIYQWKRRGEYHLFNPQTIHLLQFSSHANDYKLYKQYAKLINEQQEKAICLRGLLDFKKRKPIPLEEVEPIEEIFKRFATGAMSFGSISHEAHTTLAIAMNRIGAKSNSGEGGEDPIRYHAKGNGDSERSAIKQVASGRFGVTSHYLTNADELQIKMAQGAKPGEGGQLPGHKVNNWIARVRHATPGVGLISPPPHHDIYSIEDLAQLIFDLKNANRQARISVKLVSEAGVGVVAAGVAKAHADVILIAGHDGGTGASPLSSIRHAGLPWELGLAEAHQTLVKNKLRSRVTLQTDGQVRTGRDLAIATLLGAEEWGVATAALVVEGCIMMRKCHNNTCPVGIATQDPELRKRFQGDPKHVINFFTFLANDLREIMASLGFRTVNEMVGQANVLEVKKNLSHWKHHQMDLSPIVHQQIEGQEAGLYQQEAQDHGIENVLDHQLIAIAKETLEKGTAVTAQLPIVNTDRTVGAMLSNEISKRYGGEGLNEDSIQLHFKGAAGQSFGAFTAKGLTMRLEGEANDYFGKGLSGAKLIIHPDETATFNPAENMIIGNVAFYGGTSGEAYINGLAGERFAVRNSGVTAVVEGVGDHACEYMTGGKVLILGATGRNFAAGMSGGVAYVLQAKETFEAYCNLELVDLEALEEEDQTLVHQLVTRHYEYTQSPLAKSLLDNWEDTLPRFTKVMPRDYKAALQRMQARKEQEGIKQLPNKSTTYAKPPKEARRWDD